MFERGPDSSRSTGACISMGPDDQERSRLCLSGHEDEHIHVTREASATKRASSSPLPRRCRHAEERALMDDGTYCPGFASTSIAHASLRELRRELGRHAPRPTRPPSGDLG